MTRYIVRRVLLFIPVLLAVTLFTFVLLRIIPGGPFTIILEGKLPPEIVANLRAYYGLDKPVWQQFLIYLWNLARFDLGPSFHYRTMTVNDIIRIGLPISAHLGAMSLAVGLLIGIPAGCIAALKQNTAADYAATFAAILSASIPNIVLGPLLIWLFALTLGWLPVARWTSPAHWILPTFALGTGLSAGVARLTRGSLLQVIQADYIRTARAKGLRETVVVVHHALRNSLIPVVTILGPMFAIVLTGSFTVETIFGIPGLGPHFVTSIGNRDYPVVMGTTLLFAVLLVVANLFVDITYAWLDPRIRYE
jgi:ABC-type dipeptide/oligopeptide/nickel transport system permease component